MDYYYEMPPYTTYNPPFIAPKDPRLTSYQYPLPPAPFPPTPAPTEKTDDELWIETWLAKIGKITINLDATIEMRAPPPARRSHAPKPIPLHEIKESLRVCLAAQRQLQAIHHELETHVDRMSSAEWTAKTQEIGQVKERMSRSIQLFESVEAMRMLKWCVERRRKKRAYLKRRKRKQGREVQRVHEERREMHKSIDEWLLTKREEVERVKMEEKMKMDADCVLSEVTKKKSDAHKVLTLLTALVKLRKAREQAATQRGDKISAPDRSAFTKVTSQLEAIWSNLVHVYGKEEQGLRIMLEQNATEDSKAALALKEQKIAAEWDYILFGPKCISSSAYWALTSAKKNMDTFIAVRRSWDYFLPTAANVNGSKMPIGWILPNEDADTKWKQYLNTK